jgi:hypothetical protein
MIHSGKKSHKCSIFWVVTLPPVSADFLIGLFYNPENGGEVFLRNIRVSPHYTALQPSYCRENLNS